MIMINTITIIYHHSSLSPVFLITIIFIVNIIKTVNRNKTRLKNFD